ncbi:hypothetical protein BDP81DRAFT_440454 [Colletotrichum phormii]|uniref:Uncharacterized protein n=1 Tax=Colletotrichum phormii TaxID=359342 RepID=A0AAJ0E8I7_9PEZI|nr:uncharacterized protein BDP81DRAFT_440454 [Colletotrichum phormii]KAK1622904.1 hypothetical protein BDP81DRAFT_440454 [Colletotrichum phormii]
MRILQQYGLPQIQNSAIYAYLHGLCGDRSRIDLRFTCPALNCVDLAESDNLPSLLEMRCQLSPQHFRHSDGRHLLLSVWAGHTIPIMVEGVSFLVFHDRSSDTVEGLQLYGDPVTEVAEDETLLQISSKTMSPNVLFWQLQGQREIYQFLGSVVDTMHDTAEDDVRPVVQDYDSGMEESSLARPSRSRYSHATSINLEYLEHVIRTSLDEAKDHLWQVRRDVASWSSTRKKMAQGSGSKELLIMLFSRIDILDTLDQLIRTA